MFDDNWLATSLEVADSNVEIKVSFTYSSVLRSVLYLCSRDFVCSVIEAISAGTTVPSVSGGFRIIRLRHREKWEILFLAPGE